MKTTLLKAAVIGVGRAPGNEASQHNAGFRIAYTHSQMWRDSPRVQLVAGADISSENLAAWRSHFKVENSFLDAAEMLQTVRPDLVSICTWVGLHARFLELCAQNGVQAVVCEKPFLNSPAELGRIARLVEATGLKIVVPHVRRYCWAYKRAVALLEAGEIGVLQSSSALVPGWDLSEMASHQLDAIRQFNGDAPLDWVLGQFRVREARGFGHALEDHALAYFRFQNGARGLVETGADGWPVEGENAAPDYVLSGSDGQIAVHGFDRLRIWSRAGFREETVPNGSREGEWNFLWEAMREDLLAWLDGENPAQLAFPNVAQTSALGLGAYLSAIKGDRVEFPLSSQLDEWPVEVLARRFAAKAQSENSEVGA